MADRMELIENLSGMGKVYDENGNFIRESHYEIRVYQKIHDAQGEDVAGIKDIQGYVEIDEMELLQIGEPRVLEMDDGRRLDFFWSNNDGTIANRSGKGIYQP